MDESASQGITLYVSVSQGESGKIKTSASAHMTMAAADIQVGARPDSALGSALAISLGVASLAKASLAAVLDGARTPDEVARFAAQVAGAARVVLDHMEDPLP